jgi:hypothetical protein
MPSLKYFPREGEYTLRTEDIIKAINDSKDELALVLFAGINYYTGQFFDMPAITKAAHAVVFTPGLIWRMPLVMYPCNYMTGRLTLLAGVHINT